MPRYDVAIVGGGMVGASLALMLTSHFEKAKLPPPSIALIEAKPLTFGSHPGFDGRTIALSLGSERLFDQAGIWQALKSYCSPIESIQVSDRGHYGRVDICAEDYHFDALGQVIEIDLAGKALHQLLIDMPNVTLCCPVQITDIDVIAEGHCIHGNDGSRIECSLLVGADGAPSVVAEHARLGQLNYDFKQSAIIANLEAFEPHRQRAFERFTPNGPIALLPTNGNRWALAWCVNRGEEQSIMALDDAQFIQQLHQAFGYRAGGFKSVGLRRSYPLVLKRVQRLVGHRAVVLGNAAHGLHPVAGQGFNLGLRDVACLATLLSQQGLRGGDLGAFPILADYQRERGFDVACTITMTSTLASLFASSEKVFVAPRNLVMNAMQNCSFMKSALVKQSLGLG